MSKLKEKLSILKVEKFMKKVEGISNIQIVIEKPEEINWYSGELNHLDSDIPCLHRFPLDVNIQYLVDCIEKEVVNKHWFIISFFEFVPIYVLFYVGSFCAFLNSYYKETNSKDLTLFFYDENKILDIFLAEHEIEVRILE